MNLRNILLSCLLLIGLLACSSQTTGITPTVEEVAPNPTNETTEIITIEFWTTDNEEERIVVYNKLANQFTEIHPHIKVQIVPIEESSLAQRLDTALAANRSPHIIRMGVERVATYAADGLLDEEAAEAVIAGIGEDDFWSGPLTMVTNPATGNRSAIPYDGWLQAIWYRQDLFKNNNLNAPLTWEDINTACDMLPTTGDLNYALTIGTDPAENYVHQIFEQIAMSNNAWPFDEIGNVTMDTPEMIEALAFYTDLARCALPGPQFWRGAREAYELGDAGMLFYSTYIMDDLVDGSSTEDGGQIEILIEDLAHNSGFAPNMAGPNGEATYGQLVTLAIMRDAPSEAQEVVTYFLREGYQDILALAPFGKVPVLKSATEGWKESSPYFAYYSDDTLEQIANGYDTMQRWLFRAGYNETQRAVIGEIEGRLLIPTAISKIVLEGTLTPVEGAKFLQKEVEALYKERIE